MNSSRFVTMLNNHVILKVHENLPVCIVLTLCVQAVDMSRETTPGGGMVDLSNMSEEEQIALAMQMSLAVSKARCRLRETNVLRFR